MAALMMLTVFAACGGKSDDGNTTKAPSNSGNASAAAFKIGGIGPLTGAYANYGLSEKNGAELAVKEINAANGSDVFEWKFEDDEHDAEKSVNAYNTLKDWGLQVLAGPVTTTPSLAVAAETANDNILSMISDARDNFCLLYTSPSPRDA